MNIIKCLVDYYLYCYFNLASPSSPSVRVTAGGDLPVLHNHGHYGDGGVVCAT